MDPNTNRVSVRQSEDFEIRLPGAPTTGYTWQLASCPAQLQPLGSTYDQHAEGPAAAGSGGEQRFRFHTLKAGSYEITFELRRPWESTALQTRTLHVQVSP